MSDSVKAEFPSVVFFGSPEFCVPCLEKLAQSGAYRVIAAVTQPDKPAGRGQRFTPPPVKTCALAAGLPVYQPASLKNLHLAASEGEILNGQKFLSGEKSSTALADFLNAQAPVDIFITCAYGKILPRALLDFPRCGMINVHPSLLPRWRGAAPLQHALFAGDEKTGVSIMQVDEGLDTGPVFCRVETSIAPEETIGTLHDKLALLSADLLLSTLPKVLSGSLHAVPQPQEGATYAEKWEEDDWRINWSEPLAVTLRRIRACSPVPGARTSITGTSVKIFAAHQIADQNFPAAEPGTIVEVNKAELIVSCRGGEFAAIDEMQFPGKNRLRIAELLRGRSFSAGQQFV